MKSLVAFILSSVVGCLAFAPARAEVQGAELRLQGGGPYYTLQLPMALRSRAAAADLHDLHVLNARGDPMPFAWVDVVPVSTQEHEQAVPIFKVPGPASGAKPTAPRSWLLDARAVEGCMTALELTLPESTRGVFSLVVETSADMQHWRLVQASAQVISLEHQGQRLTSTVIDLAGTPGSYVRLTALPRSLLPDLQSARITSVNEQAAVRPMQWSEVISPTLCGPDHCDYALPRNVPLEELQWQLAEPNTLARVDMQGMIDRSIPPELHEHHRRHWHHPLHTLRLKSAGPVDAGTSSWVGLGLANVYWLVLPEGEARSPSTPMNGGFYTTLRLRTPGPISQLGPRPPSLRVGARTPTAVVLARGPAPYRLVWGDAKAASTSVPLSQLMPIRKPGDPLPEDKALPVPDAVAPQPAPRTVPTKPAPAPAPERNAIGLWAALLAGLGAMAAMAWRLLRGKPRAVDVESAASAESTVPE